MLHRRLVAIVLIAGASTCCSARADEWLNNLEQAQQLAKEQNRPILLHFYADWCGPCKNMEKNVLHAPAIDQAITANVIAVKIDLTKPNVIGERFGVEKLPTDIFIDPTGKHLLKSEGQHTISEYAGSINKAAALYQANLAKAAVKPNPSAPVAVTPKTEAMLLGYCPVTLSNHRKWEKGLPQFSHEFRGQVYMMSSADALKDFQQNPARYAPQFLGCDPVVVAKEDRAVLGSTRFAAFYDDDLYLFSTDDNRKKFKAEPDRFIREKVVLNVDEIETVVK